MRREKKGRGWEGGCIPANLLLASRRFFLARNELEVSSLASRLLSLFISLQQPLINSA
jgi:hypothetical protein